MAGMLLYVAKPRYVLWSVPFFVATLFCKYSLLAAPFGIFLHLLFKKQFRESLWFALTLGLSCASIFAVFQWRTSGAFSFHMFSTHPDRYSLGQFFVLMGLVWLSAPVVTALAIFYVTSKLRSGQPDLASLYFISATISSATAGKLGSGSNHFLEWMIASCMCAALGYAAIQSQYPRRSIQTSLLLGLSILLGVIVENRPASQPFSQLSECAEVYRYVARTKSAHILSQSLGPLLLAGKPILLTDPFEYGQLVEHGKRSDKALVDLVNARYFGLIVSTVDPEHMKPNEFGIWPPSVVDAARTNYRVVRHFNCRDSSQIMEPK
jgi:hypothetical protein